MEQAAKVGISEAEYWESSPRYVAARIRNHRYNEQHKYETGWEQARLIAWSNLRTIDKKLRNPSNLMKFPWERKVFASVELDEPTRAAMMARLDEEAAKFFGTEVPETSPPGPLSDREGGA